MNAVLSTLLCTATLLVLAPSNAAQAARARVPASRACAHAACAEGVLDQASDRCLQASSTPTSGLLFPYPGIGNTFVAPAFVGGGGYNQATGAGFNYGGPYGTYYYAGPSTVAGGRYNRATGPASTIAGGRDNTASAGYTTVGGGAHNEATRTYATVGGGSLNDATAKSAFVGGGKLNRATGETTTIGGGERNAAAGESSTVAGGGRNSASGDYATVGGGGGRYAGNTASGRSATVGGGSANLASGDHATVGGGGGGYNNYFPYYGNTASGDYATVPGGRENTAQGHFSFAAGRRALADHDGAFVWGDSQGVDKPSSTADEFSVYCSGGARFFTNSAATTGVLLAPGGGSWSSVSDRAAKENLEPVDGCEVLERLVVLPLSTWNYKEQDDAIRHMGPMAQDFRAAFGLGVSDTLIDTVDPDGVALAAIQGLHGILREHEARLAEKDAEITALRAHQAALEDRITDLARRLEGAVESR